jgi:hypothetical protein
MIDYTSYGLREKYRVQQKIWRYIKGDNILRQVEKNLSTLADTPDVQLNVQIDVIFMYSLFFFILNSTWFRVLICTHPQEHNCSVHLAVSLIEHICYQDVRNHKYKIG